MKDKILNGKNLSEIRELIQNSYIGEIVSTAGIEQQPGRVKIRVYGILDSVDLGTIRDVDLPFAYPLFNLGFGSATGGGQYSAPKVGTKVRVVFKDDIYHPRYFSPENLTEALQSEIAVDPVNFHSLLYDEDEKIKMTYSQKSGYLLDYNGSVVNIRPDGSIFINHKESSATIELKGSDIDLVCNNQVTISAPNNVTINSQLIHANGGQSVQLGSNPTQQGICGNSLMILLKGLATIINSKLPIDTAALNLVNQMEDVVLSKVVTTTWQ